MSRHTKKHIHVFLTYYGGRDDVHIRPAEDADVLEALSMVFEANAKGKKKFRASITLGSRSGRLPLGYVRLILPLATTTGNRVRTTPISVITVDVPWVIGCAKRIAEENNK